jgi:hypothetical protein
MAAANTAARAKSAAEGAWTNPYVQRFVEDGELRDNVRVAYDSARNAYDRLNNGKSTGKQLLDDKKLHRELQQAADALRDASSALREGPKKKRRGGFGKLLLLAVVGGVAAVALSEGLRNKVLDALFGAEEEFDYTSTTQPTTPPPPAGGTASVSPSPTSTNGS